MDGVRVQKNSFETSLFVVYLPKSMCKEIPDYYTSEVDGREVKHTSLAVYLTCAVAHMSAASVIRLHR